MTKEEAIEELKNVDTLDMPARLCEAHYMSIKALEQELCGNVISRQLVKDKYKERLVNSLKDDDRGIDLSKYAEEPYKAFCEFMDSIPPTTTEPKTGHCKDCKYFEYDSVAKVDGIPLIIAHEICNRWGDGCKTRENGYCFLFESQEDISSGNITKSLQDVAKIVN